MERRRGKKIEEAEMKVDKSREKKNKLKLNQKNGGVEESKQEGDTVRKLRESV